MQLVAASAEAQVQLRRDAAGTTREVSGAALTTSGGDTLNVICDGFKCQEVVAAIAPGPILLSATGATDTQTNFAVPASLPPTATLELRVCAGADPKACVTKVAPVATLSIKPGATAPTRAQIIDFCANVGNEQSAEMLETRGKNDFTVVIFDERDRAT